MNPIYASRLQISNFRPFGPDFQLHIPPKPGIVMVYGMNGLGKTSLFEAVEWLLTGDVRRISMEPEVREGKLDRFLTRRDGEEMSHQVSLRFDNDSEIRRTVTEQPAMSDLVRGLVRDEWKDRVRDTTSYFRLTMFLPQTKLTRFDREKPAEKWRLLEGPAGVDRINQIRSALNSQKTAGAFNRRLEQIRRSVESQELRLAEWVDLLSQRAMLESIPSERRRLTPEAVAKTLEGLQDELMKLDTSLSEPENGLAGSADSKLASSEGRIVQAKLGIMQSLVDAKLDDVEDHLAALAELRAVVAQWIGTQLTSERIKKDLDDAGQELASRKLSLTKLNDQLVSLEKESTSAIALQSSLQSRVQQLRQLQSAKIDADAADSSIARIEPTTLAAQQTLELAEEQSKFVQDLVQRRLQTNRRIAVLESESTQLQELHDRIAKHDAGAALEVEWRSAVVSIEQERSASQLAMIEIDKEIPVSQTNLKNLQDQRTTALSDARRLTKAIAGVCEHITQDVTTCPICLAKYEPGELTAKVQDALKNDGVDVADLDLQISRVSEEAKKLNSRRQQLSDRIEQIPAEIEGLRTLIAGRESALKKIVSDGEDLIIDTSSLTESTIARQDTCLTEQARSNEELGSLPSEQQLNQCGQIANQAVKSLRPHTISLNARLESLRQTSATNNAIVQKLSSELAVEVGNQLGSVIEDAVAQQADAAVKNASRVAQLDQLRSQEDAQKAELESLEIKTEELRAKHQSLVADAEQLRDRWIAQNFTLNPDNAALNAAIASAEARQNTLKQMRATIARTNEGIGSWLADSRLNELTEKINTLRTTAKVETNVEAESSFTDDIERSKQYLRRVQAAKDQTVVLAEELKSKTDEFNTMALKPLADKIGEYQSVLSPFPHRFGLVAKTQKSGAKLSQPIEYERRPGAKKRSVENTASTELSDGQISTLGLSTLFAASTQYQWSRWRALLLDDPLQASDIIHTSAFLDIIRGLIIKRGYQIFLSSHDLDEARYIIRKCERSGVAVTHCHIKGPGVDGVCVETS